MVHLSQKLSRNINQIAEKKQNRALPFMGAMNDVQHSWKYFKLDKRGEPIKSNWPTDRLLHPLVVQFCVLNLRGSFFGIFRSQKVLVKSVRPDASWKSWHTTVNRDIRDTACSAQWFVLMFLARFEITEYVARFCIALLLSLVLSLFGALQMAGFLRATLNALTKHSYCYNTCCTLKCWSIGAWFSV